MTQPKDTEGPREGEEAENQEVRGRAPAQAFGEPIIETSQEDRTLAAIAHAAGVLSSTMLPVLVPLIIFFLKKDESEFVAAQAKEALNFQFTIILLTLTCFFLVFFLVGIFLVFLLPIVGLLAVVFSIIGAIKTYEGKRYRYPVAIRFF